MKLYYLFHSGFAIIADEFAVIIDFYEDTADALNGFVHDELLSCGKRIYVLITHFHPDHFNPEVLSWREIHPDIIYILSNDLKRHHRAEGKDGTFLKKGETYEDNKLKVKAYGSTDSGDSFLITLQGVTFFHAGDLNNWHWIGESTEREIKKAEGDYSAELHYIAKDVDKVDVTMFPIDRRMKGDYAKGARQFLKLIKSTIFVPMHFGNDYEGGNAFKEDAEKLGAQFLSIEYRGQCFDITVNKQ